jgi:hypothetical protein
MSNQLALEVPINAVSFGSVSIALLREMHKRGLMPSIFPIGPVDLSAQKPDPAFNQWLGNCINNASLKHSRKNPAIRLWHIQGSLSSLSSTNSQLITFYEQDQITPLEINVLRNQDKVYVTSRYTQQVFGMFGIKSDYLPLGFDSHNFSALPVRPKIEGVTSFFTGGKWEARKRSAQVIRAWAKRYGNNKDYRLNCAVHNPFLKPEDQNAMIGQALEGKAYWNINWLPWSATNAEYNAVLQSSDIVLSMSGGEGRDLPCYHAVALGAWPVALRAHAFLDYLDDTNAVLVNPNGKAPGFDGVFFHPGQPVNQGAFFTWADEDFIAGCEEAERRVKSLGLNKKGMELQKQGYAEAVDILLAGVEGK